jgi:hypothetical protein
LDLFDVEEVRLGLASRGLLREEEGTEWGRNRERGSSSRGGREALDDDAFEVIVCLVSLRRWNRDE